jgi:hypothetical protein
MPVGLSNDLHTLIVTAEADAEAQSISKHGIVGQFITVSLVVIFGVPQSLGLWIPHYCNDVALLVCPIVEIAIERTDSMMPAVSVMRNYVSSMANRCGVEVECSSLRNFFVTDPDGDPRS